LAGLTKQISEDSFTYLVSLKSKFLGFEEKLFLIRNYNLWSHLSDEEYEELNLVHRYMEARKGEFIYFDPEHLTKLFFIKEGYIRLGYRNEKGEEVVREIIREGEIFGQFTLQRQDMQGEFAQAHKADVSLCAFNISDFEKILSRKPQLAIGYSKQVGQRLRQAENRLMNLLHKDVRVRLLGFFVQLVSSQAGDRMNLPLTNETGGPISQPLEIENFLTHEDIARMIASSRQTVTSMIGQFEDHGLLIWDRSFIRIPDVKKLQKAMDVG
jgi:CRP/FNR family transcriptional regulator, cyclic AMP receptor protein